MTKLISNNKLQNIYFSDNKKLKENIDIEILKKKFKSVENRKNKIKLYNEILDYQAKKIIKNQNIIKNKKTLKKTLHNGGCNNMKTLQDIIKELFTFNMNINNNFYDFKKKGLINKILFIVSNIVLTLLLFLITSNIIYIYRSKNINYFSIILIILIYFLYKLINILEQNICNDNNLIYNLEIYINNLNNYIYSNELDIKKKNELLEEINKYKNIFNTISIKNSINELVNDFITYLPCIIFILLCVSINIKLINIIILTIILTLIISPYINILINHKTTNKYIINIGYIFEKLLIIYISYLIINIIYNKDTLLDNYSLILIIIDKLKNNNR